MNEEFRPRVRRLAAVVLAGVTITLTSAMPALARERPADHDTQPPGPIASEVFGPRWDIPNTWPGIDPVTWGKCKKVADLIGLASNDDVKLYAFIGCLVMNGVKPGMFIPLDPQP